jgi:hypothetical protein
MEAYWRLSTKDSSPVTPPPNKRMQTDLPALAESLGVLPVVFACGLYWVTCVYTLVYVKEVTHEVR